MPVERAGMTQRLLVAASLAGLLQSPCWADQIILGPAGWRIYRTLLAAVPSLGLILSIALVGVLCRAFSPELAVWKAVRLCLAGFILVWGPMLLISPWPTHLVEWWTVLGMVGLLATYPLFHRLPISRPMRIGFWCAFCAAHMLSVMLALQILYARYGRAAGQTATPPPALTAPANANAGRAN